MHWKATEGGNIQSRSMISGASVSGSWMVTHMMLKSVIITE
jgi:hypothetical protein